jgi:hypothetical protein
VILNWLCSSPERYTAVTRICRILATFASGELCPLTIGVRELPRLPLMTKLHGHIR